MGNIRKKITTILLAFIVTISAMPAVSVSVYADEPENEVSKEVSVESETSASEKEEIVTDTDSQESEPSQAESNSEQGSAGDVVSEPSNADSASDAETSADETSNTAKSYNESFTVSPGEKQSEVSRITYSLYEYMSGTSSNVTINMYTVTVQEGTENITVDFGGQELIAFTYADAGKQSYIASCGNASDGSYSNGGKTGESTAVVRAVDGELPEYVWVQTPYDDSWTSSDLYAIKIETEAETGSESDISEDQGNADTSEDGDNSELGGIAEVDVSDSLAKTRTQVKLRLKNVYGEEWVVMAMTREGLTVSADYYKSVYERVEEMAGSLETGSSSYTNNARAILALTAGGFDATNVAGYNLVAKLSNYDAIIAQGINGPIFALLALDSHNYEITKAASGVTQATRDNLIQYILDNVIKGKGSDGTSYCGWAYRSSAADPDPDMTALAMMALAPYKDRADVAKTLADAEAFLKDKYTREEKNSSGKTTKASGTYGNSDSAATVIMALTTLGIDPVDFAGEGYQNLVDDLNSFQLSKGGYGYTDNKTYNAYATMDGYRALVAIQRMQTGKTSIYNMTDIAVLQILGSDGKAKSQSDGDSDSDDGKKGSGNSGTGGSGKGNSGNSGGSGNETGGNNNTSSRNLTFIQGDGGKPLTTTSTVTTDGTDTVGSESVSAGNDDNGGDSGTALGEALGNGSSEKGIFGFGENYQIPEGADLTKVAIFAALGLVFLILALVLLTRVARNSQQD